MKLRLIRPFAAGLAVAVTAGVALVAAPAAQAAPIGTLALTPTSGGLFTALAGTPSDACPAPADKFVIRISGGNLPATQNINGSAPLPGGVGTNPGTTSFSKVFDTIRGDAGLTSLADGAYTVWLECRAGLSTASLGEFTTTVNISGGGQNWAQQLPSQATTTTVTAPASAAFNTGINVSAAVAPAGATGTVQFKVDGANSGAPVAVAAGAAAYTIPAGLGAGNHTVSAQFLSSNTANFLNSAVSATQTVNVTPAPTTLSLNGTQPANTSTNITLTAQAPAGIAGSVVFDGYTGGPSSSQAVNGAGVASVTIGSLAAATYPVTAVFTPSSPNYAASNASFSLVIGNAALPTATTATEFVRTVVESGALTISVKGLTVPNPTSPVGTPVGAGAILPTPDGQNPATGIGSYGDAIADSGSTNIVYLPNAKLTSNGQYIATSGRIIPVVVTDTRAGDLGYNVNGILTDFVSGTDKINAQNVGWSPEFISFNRPGGVLVAGPVVNAELGVAENAAGTLGLKQSRKLFGAPALGSTGTAEYGALLDVVAPTTTKPGSYEASLTLTAVALP